MKFKITLVWFICDFYSSQNFLVLRSFNSNLSVTVFLVVCNQKNSDKRKKNFFIDFFSLVLHSFNSNLTLFSHFFHLIWFFRWSLTLFWCFFFIFSKKNVFFWQRKKKFVVTVFLVVCNQKNSDNRKKQWQSFFLLVLARLTQI